MTQATAVKRPYIGFVDRIEKDEQELAQLEADRTNDNEPVVDPGNPEDQPLTKGAVNWEKRYSDLRRKEQSDKKAYEDAITALRTQLIEAKKPADFKLPASEEDLAGFLTEYPGLAALIETMITKRVKEVADTSDARFEELERRRAIAEREHALAQLLRVHPDLETIRDDEEFHEWVQRQPKNIKWSLLENPTDWEAAAASIDLYKLHKSRQDAEKNKPDPALEAARGVKPSRPARTVESPAKPAKKVWKESEIELLPPDKFFELLDEIEAARVEGRIELDKSNRAR